ncbi:MAG: beta-N-acetylglucosaminidase [Bacteroidetes bacterium]|nr:MAG: beta-N-acetylglucosaminidase [Bacteroidota bacterium]
MIKRIFSFLFIIAALLTVTSCSKSHIKPELNVIPMPNHYYLHKEGGFVLDNNSRILVGDNPSSLKTAKFLASFLKEHGFNLKIKNVAQVDGIENDIILRIFDDKKEIQPEGYKLKVNAGNISIISDDGSGLFYGVQTLMQLLPDSLLSSTMQSVDIPGWIINDSPRFHYRGMHLDVGRHFFPVEFVKHYLDMMAMYKFNTFHWHLTEDQGWRIEIKKYPKLTEIGGFRDSTLVGKYSDKPHQWDGKRYGGFYTQEQIKEVVQYAADRHITIIPEIEMPGHSLAALAAYPELACTPGPFRPATLWGVFPDIYCPKEETFEFLENVLTEVMELFPGKYIHIGGDEAPKERWKESKLCQQIIKKNGLKNEEELQSYFIKRIEKFLNAHGRKLIGWDEILEGGLSSGATVMSWRGIEGGIAAARAGHDAIMTPGNYCYFDHYQAGPEGEPIAIGGMTTLKEVYEYEPVPEELNKKEAKHILGAQGNVWTEYMPTPEKVEYMVLPRMAALAEVVWTDNDKKSWPDFQRRVNNHFKRYKALGWNYCPGTYNIAFTQQKEVDITTWKVELETEIYKATIHYTTDGSVPTAQSLKYKHPLHLVKNTIVNAAIFKHDALLGKSHKFIVGKETE